MSYRRQWSVWLVVFALLLVSTRAIQQHRHKVSENTRDYSQLLSEIEQGKVERIRVLDDGRMLLAKLQGKNEDIRVFGPADLTVLNEDIQRCQPVGSNLELQYPPPGFGKDLARYVVGTIPIIVVVFVLYLLFMRQVSAGSNQTMAFSQSRARRLTDASPRKTFDDVAGVDEAVDELREVVDFLRAADRYRSVGAEIPKGVLLMGPPGCGKTLLARAIAGEANVPFFHLSGSDFVEMFVGVGASRVRDLFEKAKASRPCIVFIDELDAVGRHRGAGLGGGHDEREQTVNQLLVEMDGFEPNSGVIVVAATNRPDILDPALLRPGRFDRRVVVDAPDLSGRQAILDLHLKSRPVAPDVSTDILARQTPGLTGADLYSIVNEASILAARSERQTIRMADFEESIQRVVSGRERRSRVLLPAEREAVAYHEAGHALVAHYHEHCTPVHKISILPRGMALGYVLMLPAEERYNRTLAELRSTMAQLLGGRAAEELVYGHDNVSTGAQNDLERVTAVARSIVCEYGMSDEIGPRTLGHRHGPIFLGREIAEDRNYSEEMAHRIDVEIRRFVDEAHDVALAAIEAHRTELDELVRELLQKETLDAAEVKAILGDGPPSRGRERANLAAIKTAEPPREENG